MTNDQPDQPDESDLPDQSDRPVHPVALCARTPSPDTPPPPLPIPSSGLRKLLAPALCCIAAGLLISLLPILLLLKNGQRPVWIADSDELLYLTIAGQSYFEHPFHLGDPILQGHSGRSMYPWIQLAPGILPASLLHLGPLAIGFFWRAFAGFSMGLGIFLVLWKIIRRPWMAAAGAIWMLSDAGMLTGQPFFQHLAAMRKLALVRGDYLIAGEPQIMRLWRIITPGLSLVYLLIFLFALLHLRASPSRRSTAFAGIAFGLLFYVCVLLLDGRRAGARGLRRLGQRPPAFRHFYGPDREFYRDPSHLQRFLAQKLDRPRLARAGSVRAHPPFLPPDPVHRSRWPPHDLPVLGPGPAPGFIAGLGAGVFRNDSRQPPDRHGAAN